MHINLKIARRSNLCLKSGKQIPGKRRIKRIQKVRSLLIEGNHTGERSEKNKILGTRTENKTTAESWYSNYLQTSNFVQFSHLKNIAKSKTTVIAVEKVLFQRKDSLIEIRHMHILCFPTSYATYWFACY